MGDAALCAHHLLLTKNIAAAALLARTNPINEELGADIE
jgi:hypothetical protein